MCLNMSTYKQTNMIENIFVDKNYDMKLNGKFINVQTFFKDNFVLKITYKKINLFVKNNLPLLLPDNVENKFK